MKIAGTIFNSVVNGIGIRDVIFLQGCGHHCIGCHNPQTWDGNGGKEYDITKLADMFANSTNPITISGGEPLLQYEELYVFLTYISIWQNKRCWLYTGYSYEEIPIEWLTELSRYVDVLVDGRFEIDKKDLTLQFRGSSNQRLIDLPKSVAANQIILWEEKDNER